MQQVLELVICAVQYTSTVYKPLMLELNVNPLSDWLDINFSQTERCGISLTTAEDKPSDSLHPHFHNKGTTVFTHHHVWHFNNYHAVNQSDRTMPVALQRFG